MKKLKLLLALFVLFFFFFCMCYAETDYTNLMSSDWTGASGNFGGGKERYQAANYESGKILYQSFVAPASGIYEIKFYAVASSTSGRNFDNVYGDNIAQAYVLVDANKVTVPMTVINQTGCTLVEDANIRTLSIEANEGVTIEYGLENIATGGNWYTIKGLSVKMKTVAELFQDQYDEAYAIWQYSTENEAGARNTFKSAVDALQTAMNGTLSEAQTASNALKTALETYENKSYPIKGNGVKYNFTSKMNMAINAWTCKQGNGPAQYGFTGATETYGGTNAGEVMYQIITGLANGEYEIHFYAVANAANNGGIASEESAKKVYVYANDQTLDIAVIQQNSCTPSDYERTFTLMVNDGTIKYGITNNDAAGNWYICKNVALYMTGAPDLSDYYDAIEGKLTTANGLKTSPMKSTVLDALQDAIDATEGYNGITVIGTLETLSNNLTLAINNANVSVSNYSEALDILQAASMLDATGQSSYATDETVSAIQSAYDARTLVNVSSVQKTACIAALRAAARTQTTGNSDWSAVIVNPSFEDDWNGWENVGNMARQNNTSFSLKDGSYYAEFWQPNGLKGVKQTVNNIPAGIYSITASALARGVTSAKLYAGKGEKTVVVKDAADTYTLEFIQEDDGDLTFGFEGTGIGADASWICVDNFTMKYIGTALADYKLVLNNVITNANDIITAGANIGTDVFQIPMSAQTALSTAKTTAQGVYNNGDATLSDVKTAISDLNDALAIYKKTLNVPDAEKHYYIKVATAKHAKINKALLIASGSTSESNPTGYTLTANLDPNENLSQAVSFTHVSDNIYNISFETTEGTAYLTYGVKNGSTAGHKNSQIQATKDSSKKGEFRIVATETDNVFYIYNTITNTTIACQSGGNIYTEDGNANFSVVEASQAIVNVSINAAVKYGTRIFPFAPTLPSGVKAYTCDATNATLVLTEDDAPKANVPYILVAEEGCASTDLKGWGVLSSTDPKAGGDDNHLTGVYTATPAPVGSYVLQNQEGKVAFYKVADDKQPTVGAYRCYLTAPSGGESRSAFYFEENETTAIQAVEALIGGNAEVFNAAGARLPILQKGLNIVKHNDKSYKVIVK